MENNPNAPFSSAPPCFLVEVMGDSETGSDLTWNVPGPGEDGNAGAGLDSDDAESCSYDSSDHRILADDGEYGDDAGAAAAGTSEGARELEADQFAAYQAGLFKQDPAAEHKSCASVDSTSPANELLSEMERSRRFWEACLASS